MSPDSKTKPLPTPKPPERDPVLEDLIWLQQTREARLAAARAQRTR
ncbi:MULTISPECIES: hypothetical protein [unclassified Streptomyces]|nr:MULTISPECIES: hypothetical protein [unclassified Streptomyces]MYQ50072.1 hypothetical protein [Streptomyces sp. SID4941]SCD32873.1 hypothetical protein GA0115247_102739 [Streptomyces sp. PalvLS-984]SDE13007.1 hypothetical protein F558DRAFT_05595 [Streptomyces sp. AmelKG-A3]